FRYGARELPLVTLMVSGLVTALLPLVAGSEAAGLQALRQRTTQFAHWLFPVSAVLILLTPWLFPIVYNPEFAASADVFNVYLLIIISRLLLPQVIIISRDRSYVLVRNAILETILNVGLSLWLVRDFGLPGIAFATVIAFVLAKINLIWFVWKSLGIKPNLYIPVRLYAYYSFGLISVYLLGRFIIG
ncbi:MAG: polysaccharide biosynthesis C-terminal domain-containing protein, partial [Saprospiraceae bacterium]|nr:polysaccharide biosynthesis C-terminal domain-containing protein [Saprospiraceae bacterium]